MNALELGRRARIVAGPASFALVWWLLPDRFTAADGSMGELSGAGRATVAMMAWMAVWWLSEAVAIEATALLPVALFPLLGIAGIAQAAAPYASDVVFLFLGGFMLAAALQRWGLDRRIAFAVLARVGSRPAQLLGGLMIATAFLSMWVSNTATAAIMMPIAISLAGLWGDGESDAGLAPALVLAVAYAASIGGMATLIGSPPNGIAARFIAQASGEPISFAHWMLIAAPAAALMLLACWWWLARRLPHGAGAGRHAPDARAAIAEAAARLGPMSRGARTTLAVCAATAALWIFRPVLVTLELAGSRPLAGLSDAGIAIGAALALFVLPADRATTGKPATRLLDWASASRLPWGVLVLFGGGLSLAAAIEANGVAEFVGAQSVNLAGWPPLLVLVVVLAITIFLSELTSNTAQAATMIPLLAAMAAGLGLDPALLIVACALGSSCAFMMPVGTPPNAIAFGTGLVSMQRMWRTGFVLNLIAIAVLGAVISLWVPAVYGR
ncbi:MAG TPA: DASS family sodium-coupled anion symporter [Burkholderiaceae bacterium]|nr:DASS family sodium-coupled anion symporter [Burkholderiaceae bacterium]